MSEFRKELESLINKKSKENGSDTPDFILVEYLNDCLTAFDKATTARTKWYGKGRDPIFDLMGDMKADAS